MSIVMKKKLTTTALAIATIMGMGYCMQASAVDSVTLNTDITVHSDNKCSWGVGQTAASLIGWKLNYNWGAAAPSGTLTPDAGQTAQVAPLYVTVKPDEGNADACNLNAMKLSAELPSASQKADGAGNAFTVKTTDGAWRFMPVLAHLQTFGGDDATSDESDGTKIIVTDVNGTKHAQGENAFTTGHKTVSTIADFKSHPAFILTDNWLSADSLVPIAGGANMAVSYQSTDDKIVPKSASFGFGVIVAVDPEDSSGEVYPEAVVDTDIVSMPFTVNISYL